MAEPIGRFLSSPPRSQDESGKSGISQFDASVSFSTIPPKISFGFDKITRSKGS